MPPPFGTTPDPERNNHFVFSNPTDSRTEPNLDDLDLAFRDIGVYLSELEDYVSQVDQVPFIHQLPQYPKPKPCVLHHPRNGEIAERLEQYYDYLPPLVSKLLQTEGFVWLLLLQSSSFPHSSKHLFL